MAEVFWGAVGVVGAVALLVWIWVVTGPPADEIDARNLSEPTPHTPEPSEPPSSPP